MKATCVAIGLLEQIESLVCQLNDETFSKKCSIIGGASIGSHIRHVLDFYQCFFTGIQEGAINYDDRERNLLLEQNKEASLAKIKTTILALQNLPKDLRVDIIVSYPLSEVSMKMSGTLQRELVYNIEHCVHHMALMKAAVLSFELTLAIPTHFGVAQSTSYHKKQA